MSARNGSAGPDSTGGTRWNRLRYSLYAPVYDRVLRLLPMFRRGRRRSLELAAPRSGERVLLVAAGTGLDLEHSDLLPPSLEIVATDITPAMIERTVRRAQRLRRRLRAEVMDAASLSLPDESFDIVVLHLALAVVPDPIGAIREAARVLRPGGRVAVFDKFLSDHASPSRGRRLASAIASVIATDLNRQLGPLLDAAGLVLVHREPVALGGMFVAARAEKPAHGVEVIA